MDVAPNFKKRSLAAQKKVQTSLLKWLEGLSSKFQELFLKVPSFASDKNFVNILHKDQNVTIDVATGT